MENESKREQIMWFEHSFWPRCYLMEAMCGSGQTHGWSLGSFPGADLATPQALLGRRINPVNAIKTQPWAFKTTPHLFAWKQATIKSSVWSS